MVDDIRIAAVPDDDDTDKPKKMKPTLEEIARTTADKWRERYLKPNAVESLVQRTLTDYLDKVVLETIGFERTFGDVRIKRTNGRIPIIDQELADRATGAARQLIAAALEKPVVFSEADLKMIRRAYKETIMEQVLQEATMRARMDAVEVVNRAMNEELIGASDIENEAGKHK